MAVVGTGATGVQVIAALSDMVGDLTVFQRRPNWCAPLNNGPISDAEMADIRARYDQIFAKCLTSPGGFEHEPDRRGFYEVTREERLALWDKLYAEPGFGIWLSNFREIFFDETANAEFSEYVANRIRQRVKDPVVAEKLIPKDHGFGVQRVPLETKYYEAYNKPHVHLVDIAETPIERVTPTGIRTSERDYDFDIIVYATGFDAITGSYDRIDFEGVNGEKLRDKWRDGPITYVGMQIHGFPNLITIAGPQSGSASTNYPRGIEVGVDWATGLLQYAREHGYTRMEATPEAEQQWSDQVAQMYATVLMRKAKGWFTGYNSNVEGHEAGRIRYFVYNGGSPKFRQTIIDIANEGYPGIVFRRAGSNEPERRARATRWARRRRAKGATSPHHPPPLAPLIEHSRRPRRQQCRCNERDRREQHDAFELVIAENRSRDRRSRGKAEAVHESADRGHVAVVIHFGDDAEQIRNRQAEEHVRADVGRKIRKRRRHQQQCYGARRRHGTEDNRRHSTAARRPPRTSSAAGPPTHIPTPIALPITDAPSA